MRLRLLPVLVVVTGVTLMLRVNLLWHDAGVALADAAAKPDAAAPAAPAAAGDAPAPAAAAPSGDAATAPPPADQLKPGQTSKFSPAEVSLLQDLSKRQRELDKRSEGLDRREVLIKATEQQLQEKIDKLTSLKADIQKLTQIKTEEEDKRLVSLVAIYEAMKPADAAKIVSGLDMPVVISLLSRMNDRKTSAILAAMDPKKAGEITLALAERKQVPDQNDK